ncbi:hypothetical protein F7Q99_34750 [Streptomyces kaniharaensis]|uniref:Uncharacterized protein n=1 Tax=Streptomyces kaniharaensis TaxID=212423 RepID=A0A6N7L5F6_9ACTN|nr:hypothetical protein [Streptomyces kaniharaensis]MQS17203.1 hypothetical protein [Streptomyces kaniharaensis]
MDSYNVKRRSFFTWYVTHNGVSLDLSGYLGKSFASSRRTAEFYAGFFTRSDNYQAEYGLLLTQRPPYCELPEITATRDALNLLTLTFKAASRDTVGLLILAACIAPVCFLTLCAVEAL